MLKPEILDPQGQAVQRALPRLGFEGISDVRQGKRFELEVEGPVDEAALARIRDLAESFLANTVIENFDVKVEDAAGASGGTGSAAPAATAGAEK
ncbi:phosphoribosylformylglycinamidine synthase subunit PurS [Streptomyces sp. TS71-3]|nr:phosphoribosylformylglycinamidine synthase subunit PurS [Streptomyces sp. TS71-3]